MRPTKRSRVDSAQARFTAKVVFPLLLPPQTAMILLLTAHTPFLKDQVQFAGVFGFNELFCLYFGND